MIGSVTKRFLKFHDKLIAEKKIKSSRQFAIALNFLPQSLNEILKGRREVTVELIRKTIEVFELNPMYIFAGKGDMFYEDKEVEVKTVTIVTNEIGTSKILYVPANLQIRYATKKLSEKVIAELSHVMVPELVSSESYRCFEVRGDFMEPTLYEGEKVVAKYIEPMFWQSGIKDDFIFVVVTKMDVFVCRVLNHLRETKSFKLYNDKAEYKSWEVKLSEVREMWSISHKISPFFSVPKDPNEIFKKELESLEKSNKFLAQCIRELERQMKDFNKKPIQL